MLLTNSVMQKAIQRCKYRELGFITLIVITIKMNQQTDIISIIPNVAIAITPTDVYHPNSVLAFESTTKTHKIHTAIGILQLTT